MKKKRSMRSILMLTIAIGFCVGMSSCAGWFGTIGIGPNGPVVDGGVTITGGDPGPGPAPINPGPGGPGGPAGPDGPDSPF